MDEVNAWMTCSLVLSKVEVEAKVVRGLTQNKQWCLSFRTGNSKGARWMPRLAQAMKDVTSLRKVSGR